MYLSTALVMPVSQPRHFVDSPLNLTGIVNADANLLDNEVDKLMTMTWLLETPQQQCWHICRVVEPPSIMMASPALQSFAAARPIASF